ncbi:MAG: hypothetical protein SPK29_05480 [Peptoniphilaceae bacterium]|nr:hypothetical protein [Peptoniphilaceae bacterium]
MFRKHVSANPKKGYRKSYTRYEGLEGKSFREIKCKSTSNMFRRSASAFPVVDYDITGLQPWMN